METPNRFRFGVLFGCDPTECAVCFLCGTVSAGRGKRRDSFCTFCRSAQYCGEVWAQQIVQFDFCVVAFPQVVGSGGNHSAQSVASGSCAKEVGAATSGWSVGRQSWNGSARVKAGVQEGRRGAGECGEWPIIKLLELTGVHQYVRVNGCGHESE